MDVWQNSKARLISTTSPSSHCMFNINPFFPIFLFDSPQNIRKPKVFWCFEGNQKGSLRRKGLMIKNLSKLWILFNFNNNNTRRNKKSFIKICSLGLFFLVLKGKKKTATQCINNTFFTTSSQTFDHNWSFQHWSIFYRSHSFSTEAKFSEQLTFLGSWYEHIHQGVRNVSFSENFAYELNEWPYTWDSNWYHNDLLGYITIRYNNIDDVVYQRKFHDTICRRGGW